MCSSCPASRLRASQPSSFLFAIQRFLQRVSRRRRMRGSCTERNKSSKHNEWVEASEGPTGVNERKERRKASVKSPKRRKESKATEIGNRSTTRKERLGGKGLFRWSWEGRRRCSRANSPSPSPTGRRRARAARQAQSCHSALSGQKQAKT